MTLGRENVSVTRAHGDADVFGLARFLRDDDLIAITPFRSRRQQLRLVTLFAGGLPVRESCAPAEIDGLTAGSAEFETTYVERCGCLPVAEVGHQGGQIGPRDDVEQFFLIG